MKKYIALGFVIFTIGCQSGPGSKVVENQPVAEQPPTIPPESSNQSELPVKDAYERERHERDEQASTVAPVETEQSKPEPIVLDSSLFFHDETASISMRAVMKFLDNGSVAVKPNQYYFQFRHIFSSSVSLQNIFVLAGLELTTLQRGNVVLPSAKGYTVSMDSAALAKYDTERPLTLGFELNGLAYTAYIEKHRLITVEPAP